jgi:hypothetical protein
VIARRRLVAIAAAVLALAAGIVIVWRLTRHDSQTSSSSPASTPDLSDPLVVEFRETERTCITAFNEALARQRRNELDELGLAAAIDHEVLARWQALRLKVDAATPPSRNAELYAALRRYLEARQIAWQAYVAGLRAGSDEASRPHYDAYHAKNAEADDAARELGRLFRSAAN